MHEVSKYLLVGLRTDLTKETTIERVLTQEYKVFIDVTCIINRLMVVPLVSACLTSQI